jgi:hypothetical protein
VSGGETEHVSAEGDPHRPQHRIRSERQTAAVALRREPAAVPTPAVLLRTLRARADPDRRVVRPRVNNVDRPGVPGRDGLYVHSTPPIPGSHRDLPWNVKLARCGSHCKYEGDGSARWTLVLVRGDYSESPVTGKRLDPPTSAATASRQTPASRRGLQRLMTCGALRPLGGIADSHPARRQGRL